MIAMIANAAFLSAGYPIYKPRVKTIIYVVRHGLVFFVKLHLR